jgi:HSP20 family molecular chaperone IbpA
MLYKDLDDFMRVWMEPLDKNRYHRNDRINKYNKYILREEYDKDDVNNYIISLSIPGIEIEKLDVVVDDNILSIKYNGLYNGKTEISFEKSYEFGQHFKFNDDVKCKYVNGILNIYIPKSVKIERKLQIEA